MNTQKFITLENQTMKFFYSKLEIKKYVFVGEEVVAFETNDIMVEYSVDLGFNDIKFPYAYAENNIYFMLHRKNIPIQEYETSTVKSEHEFLYKKDENLKGDNITDEDKGIIEYGNEFMNCNIIHNRESSTFSKILSLNSICQDFSKVYHT